MDDVRTDAACCERAALFGAPEGGPISFVRRDLSRASLRACAYGSYARRPEIGRRYYPPHIELIDRAWGTGEYMARFNAPSRASDETFRRALARRERQSASPSAAIAILQMNSEIDARHILPTIRVPTLVLHRVGDGRITIDAGRYLATHIPGAKYVELPGTDHTFFGERDIADRIVEEIEEFLTGSHTESEPDRVLATVLFTDIVDSTKRAAELGDRGWRALLNRHDEATREEFARFRGREVKTLMDFSRPSMGRPAVRCASAIIERVHQLGIEVRGGLHTGEIEIQHDDVAGIAVHIAARSDDGKRQRGARVQHRAGSSPAGLRF